MYVQQTYLSTALSEALVVLPFKVICKQEVCPHSPPHPELLRLQDWKCHTIAKSSAVSCLMFVWPTCRFLLKTVYFSQIVKCKERTTLQTINEKIRTGSPYVKHFGDMIFSSLILAKWVSSYYSHLQRNSLHELHFHLRDTHIPFLQERSAHLLTFKNINWSPPTLPWFVKCLSLNLYSKTPVSLWFFSFTFVSTAFTNSFSSKYLMLIIQVCCHRQWSLDCRVSMLLPSMVLHFE